MALRHGAILDAAKRNIEALPNGVVWSFTCTDEDDSTSPAVLNIYIKEEQWSTVVAMLEFKRYVERSTKDEIPKYVTYRDGAVAISLIQLED